MTKRFRLSALAVVAIAGVLGYSAISGKRIAAERPIAGALPEPEPIVATTPEFVIDDCCTFPDMTQTQLLDALQNQRIDESAQRDLSVTEPLGSSERSD